MKPNKSTGTCQHPMVELLQLVQHEKDIGFKLDECCRD